MGDRQFRFDTYTSKTATRATPLSLPLEDFYTLLEHEETDCVSPEGIPGCVGKKCPQKNGLAWTAGAISEPCQCGSTKEATKSGRCPECRGSTRLARNVGGLDFAVFDVDHINQVQLEGMLDRLEGVELYLHTTHNHLPPDDQSFRLVFPLARTITPLEWKQLWPAIVRKFNLPEIPGPPKCGVDTATKDPARLSFFARALRGRPFINVRQEGPLLDPRDLLLENVRHARTVTTAPAGERPEPGSIDLDELRVRLRKYDPDDDADGSKKEIIRKVLAEEPLAEKGSRGFTTLRVGAIVGWAVPLGTPAEAALELIRPAISKIEVLDDDKPEENSIDAWMLQAQRGYENAQTGKEEKIAEENSARGMLVAAAKRKKEKALGFLTPAQRATASTPQGAALTLVPPPPPSADRTPTHFPVPPEVRDRDNDGDWRLEKLITMVDKQGLPHPKNTFANLVAVLENHRAWKGALRYNDLLNEPEAHGGPIPMTKRDPRRLITAIRCWMAHEEELEMQNFEVVGAVEFVSYEHRYDPIKSYLTSLKWDGVSRVRDWLITYCGARLEDDSGLNVAEYVRMVGEKWLMAAAARALYPGCKADNVLVFEGEQYEGKSKMLGILAGEWFADTKLDLNNKSTLEMTSRNWIIELSELASMKKSETDAQKSFFSTSADSFRLSYAPRVEKFKRRCVFAGTTNDTRYLLDLTGNRRFWSVWCALFDLLAVKRDRDQLWAEAVAKVRAGETCPKCDGVSERCPEHRWWLDKVQTLFAEKVAVTRLKSEYADAIRTWWLAKEPKTRQLHLSTTTILRDALGLGIEKLESQQVSIGRSMKSLGFEKKQIRVPGGREWVYEASPELLAAEQWVLSPTDAQKAVMLAKRTKIGPPQVAGGASGATQTEAKA